MRFILLPLTAALLMPVGLFADELPTLKAGLWQINTKNGDQAVETTKQCVDDATSAELMNFGQKMLGDMCTSFEIKKEGSGYTSTAECQMGKSKLFSKTVLTGDFTTQYKNVTESRFDPPFFGQSQTKSVSDASYLGACGADLQPGDILKADGTKINVIAMMKQLPNLGETMRKMNEAMQDLPER